MYSLLLYLKNSEQQTRHEIMSRGFEATRRIPAKRRSFSAERSRTNPINKIIQPFCYSSNNHVVEKLFNYNIVPVLLMPFMPIHWRPRKSN